MAAPSADHPIVLDIRAWLSLSIFCTAIRPIQASPLPGAFSRQANFLPNAFELRSIALMATTTYQVTNPTPSRVQHHNTVGQSASPDGAHGRVWCAPRRLGVPALAALTGSVTGTSRSDEEHEQDQTLSTAQPSDIWVQKQPSAGIVRRIVGTGALHARGAGRSGDLSHSQTAARYQLLA